MHIIVCVKQVPDTTEIKVDPETNTLIREGVNSTLNLFDEWAIDVAMRIKHDVGGKVTALTMGPPQAEAVLRDAASLGADAGILLSDVAFAGADTLATSYTLSQAIRKIGDFDLIICGKQAVDGDTAQVGPGIAAHLDIPQIVFVKEIHTVNTESIVVERLAENGSEKVEVQLPALMSVEKGITNLNRPSLSGIARSRKFEIKKWTAEDIDVDPTRLGLKGSPTWVDQVFSPPKRSEGKILQGDVHQMVETFFQDIEI